MNIPPFDSDLQQYRHYQRGLLVLTAAEKSESSFSVFVFQLPIAGANRGIELSDGKRSSDCYLYRRFLYDERKWTGERSLKLTNALN